ncbi:YceI family protein [Fulvivirgaceae bacterium BMA10]|uniref:YceI family protein n=1 Tax=Splendidivirga corallicola TaxID=3051826 RepID=A0ABT8KPB1_9BACT|nr:YceI family protein [Fulvivirgaceae bacterium BMA10]
MNLFTIYSVILYFLWTVGGTSDQEMYIATNGTVNFKSNAPLEVIEAYSNSAKGIIKVEDKSVAYSIDISSFQGFRNKLQREHFLENYMEVTNYPKASFLGKIIENIDFSSEGEFKVRAKGILSIHGVGQERIIRSTIKIGQGIINLSSDFTVSLEDHNITVPKVVNQKIAEKIIVSVNTTFIKK